MTSCQHDEHGQLCNQAADVRHYLTGPRCPAHTPAALDGRTDHTPDPDLTLEAVAARAGRPIQPLGPLPLTPREGVVKAARSIRKTKRGG